MKICISLIVLSMNMLYAMESIVSVCPMNSCYSKGYSATFQDGKTIEVTRCKCSGPRWGITRLSVLNSNIVARGNEKFRDKSANEWFEQLKDVHTKQRKLI